jgi:shikimate kinase/3-dehydroquinate synthase
VDVVLVGLPGAGKTEVGRRLAAALGARFMDVDAEVERAAGRSVAAIFSEAGEDAFRALERAAIAALPRPGEAGGIGEAGGLGGAREVGDAGLVIATGGGTIVDPRNRWGLFPGRRVLWLDAPDAILAERLRRSPVVRPLLSEGKLEAGLARLRADRVRFFAAGEPVDASGPVAASVAAASDVLARPAGVTPLLRADLAIGRVVLGPGVAGTALGGELARCGARRAIVLTEPRTWAAAGETIRAGLHAADWPVEVVELPEGEAAKRLEVVERVAGELAALGVERGEPVVAVGGGALTDAAGFVAATFGRGLAWIAVPTTLVGQLDAAHGGKTAVDIGAGKNLVGAFHLPAAVIVDPDLLASLPERPRRAALAEAVKAGLLGDERLLELLEADGPAIASGGDEARRSLAEVVERAMWLKLQAVEGDPTERGDRIRLNLGHTLGHAIEAAAGFGPVLHGEAVAYGLRAAARIGEARSVTPAARRERIDALLDGLRLAVEPLDLELDDVLGRLETDKKRRGGAIRWVLPTSDGWTVRDDVPPSLVATVARAVLAGTTSGVAA